MSRSHALASVSDHDLVAAVAAQEEWIEALLHRLVETPTTLGAEEGGQVVVADALRELGLEPLDVPMDAAALRASPLAAPFEWDVEGKRNVVATWAAVEHGGRSLTLNGHIDVVPPAAEPLWTHGPFTPTREGDWLVGRGAGDMKGGLAAVLGAVRALRSLDLAPLADVQLQSVVEEECGGNGALQCLLSLPHTDAAVIPEPFPAAISVTQVGVLWFHVEIEGIPVHVGDAGEGVNAIDAAVRVIARLRELEVELNEAPPPPYDAASHPINLNVGVIRGGDWPSTVPAACTLSCRLALFPGQDVAELRRRVEAAVERSTQDHAWLERHPPRVRYEGFAGRGVEVPHDAPIVQALTAAHQAVAGAPPALVPTTATTDARVFVESGIPTVCYGPHAERIHGVDERVHLPSITSTAQALALLIRDWCGVTA
jgi:acetylornithine deacetylase